MGRRRYSRIKDYASARDALQRARDPERGRPLARNTRLHGCDAAISIRYHQTDIVTYYRNGDIGITNGGWWTRSTMDRIETFSPVRLATYDDHWVIHWNGKSYIFQNCLLPKDRRKRPTTSNWRATLANKSNYLIPLAKYQAGQAEAKEAHVLIRRASRLIIQHGLESSLGKSLARQMEAKLRCLQEEFLDLRAAEAAALERARAPAEAAAGKELRKITLDTTGIV